MQTSKQYCNNQQPDNPYNEANIISRTFFWWLNPFIRKGFVQQLTLQDLYRAPDEDLSEDLGKKLMKQWDKELLVRERGGRPSFVRALCRAFGLWYMLAGVWVSIGECIFRLMQAVALGWLIRDANYYASLEPLTSSAIRNEAYNQVFFDGLYLILFSIITLVTVHPHIYCCQHTGMKVRIASCHLIYRHALKLSHSALGQTTVGQMVNLLSNDVNRFDVALIYMHYLIVAPLQALIAVVLLSANYLGLYATLAGAGLFLFYVPFQTQMGQWFGQLRAKTAQRTDERIRLMNEIIPAMRVIKMYCWEEPFARLVDLARRNEVKLIRRTSILRGINMALFFVSSKLIVFLSLITYILLGYQLNPEIVFVSITLFNSVRLLMTLFFPYGVAQVAETLISCTRLQDFLLLPIQEESRRLIRGQMDGQRVPKESVKLVSSDACANWTLLDKPIGGGGGGHGAGDQGSRGKFSDQSLEKRGWKKGIAPGPANLSKKSGLFSSKKIPVDTSKSGSLAELALSRKATISGSMTTFAETSLTLSGQNAISALRNISYELKAGELMMVLGSVGSGKSSVLMSILGELPLVSGKISIDGLVSYAAQEAWIFAGTLRDNVLFGKRFDEARYEKVLSVCALDRDLQLFPQGDQTIVGERGVSLSGGQRARINLARAVYHEADIYLLDDPLSAVDAIVAKHIFNECICDYLKDKAVILATHQTQFVRKNTKVLFIEEGRQISCKDCSDNKELQSFISSAWEKSDSESASGKKTKSTAAKGSSITNLTRFALDKQQQQQQQPAQATTTTGKNGGNGADEDEPEDDPKTIDQLPFKSTPFVQQQQLDDDDPNVIESDSAKLAKMSMYLYYMKASSSLLLIIILVISSIGTQILFNGSDFWLSLWTDTEQRKSQARFLNFSRTLTDKLTLEQNAYIYSGLVASLFLLSLVRTSSFFIACTRSSINMHDRLFRSILSAPIKFFDLNPIGNFLNRVSRDMGIVDDMLPPTGFDTLEIMLNLLGTLIVVAIILPINIVPAIVLCTVVFIIRLLYMRTVRSLKTIEGTTRSPIFSHLTASLNGLTTIRAFRVEPQFEVKFDQFQDVHSSAWYLFIASSRWLGMTTDWISLGYIAVITIVLSLSTDSVTASQLGLAISSALLISGSFQWGIRQSTELESQMTSVARIKEYSELPEEPSLESDLYSKPPHDWPHEGGIQFREVSLRYFEHDEPVLKRLTFDIKPGERIGIVGRTGAGKSSIISVLFRLTEPEGSIYIDGIETKSIGLHDLRRKLSIIPQEPVLFNGTVRRNLDPFGEYVDSEIWASLDKVKLADLIRNLPGMLNAELSEGGSNFSVGERQLICLARAVLRQNKIIILDEATANVDPNTDKLIQRTINEAFTDCTQLTIAHRLNTIMNSDRVLVMEAGQAREFDAPHLLLQREGSLFLNMVENSGKNAAHLKKLAKNYYLKRSDRIRTPTHEIKDQDSPS